MDVKTVEEEDYEIENKIKINPDISNVSCGSWST
jgi:hypothetical protein